MRPFQDMRKEDRRSLHRLIYLAFSGVDTITMPDGDKRFLQVTCTAGRPASLATLCRCCFYLLMTLFLEMMIKFFLDEAELFLPYLVTQLQGQSLNIYMPTNLIHIQLCHYYIFIL